MDHLLLHLPVRHDQGVAIGQHQEIGHPFQPSPGDGHLTVAGSRKEMGKADGRTIAGDDTKRKAGWTEPIGQGVGIGAELATGWAKKETEPSRTAQQVDQFTALVRWAEHDHPAQVG